MAKYVEISKSGNNYVVNPNYVAKEEQIKTVNITSNGQTTVTPDEDKTLSSVTVNVSVDVSGVETNKEATIDVSEYSAPVEITPTTGNDAMQKVTVTLNNIPHSASAYCWGIVIDETSTGAYLNIDIAPETASGNDILRLDGTLTASLQINPELSEGDVYTKVSDTSFTIEYEEEGQTKVATYTRDSTKDITLWQI